MKYWCPGNIWPGGYSQGVTQYPGGQGVPVEKVGYLKVEFGIHGIRLWKVGPVSGGIWIYGAAFHIGNP